MTDLGLSTQSASLIAGFAGAMSIVGAILFGFLAERFPIRYVFFACYLVLAMGILTLLAANRAGTAFLYPYVPLFGISLGASYTVYPLIVADLFGIRALGAIFGLLGTAYVIGGALGPTVAGYIFDLSGNYEIVLLLSLALSLLGGALILFVGHPLRFAASKEGKGEGRAVAW
jgi:MFS family permease